MLKRVGLYSWAGPGTERIIKTKYFSPKIDSGSLFTAYDYSYMLKLKEIFGVTDAWISYSWGFSDQKEKIDHNFTIDRLENFKKLKIKTHGYLQGCNLVYDDFKTKDFWCVDEKGRLITYYKGRKVTCVNNPNFNEFFVKRLKEMCKHSFDGIYIDNIQMGQLGIPMPGDNLPFVFAGCRCKYCQNKFFDKYSKEIPTDFEVDVDLTKKYLDFRVESLTEFVTKMSKIVHGYKKIFGTNSYDPKFNTKNVYGFDVNKLQKIQDYILFENHSLHENYIDNKYIEKLNLTKPTFVVSYKKGIGFESQYSQKDFDLIYSDAKSADFYPLLKVSEFTTNGIWHNLKLNNLHKPETNLLQTKRVNSNKESFVLKIIQNKLLRNLIKNKYNQGYTLIMESRYLRPLINIVYVLVLH